MYHINVFIEETSTGAKPQIAKFLKLEKVFFDQFYKTPDLQLHVNLLDGKTVGNESSLEVSPEIHPFKPAPSHTVPVKIKMW